MICPTCAHDNLPGAEECSRCQQDLTQLDQPSACNRVERSLMEDPVSLLQPRVPVTVGSSTTIREAMQTMLARDIGALLIVGDDGKLLGVFSERDLLTKVAGTHEDYAGLPVRQFMTCNPETVTPGDTLAFALHKMDIGGYRHTPVVENSVPVGMISVRDMLHHITRLCKGG
ncbi:MAG TPA: CBS domain-containing protein [Gemmataceae bacterium]|nr:CBS domain-containing protein [Gemmataceae bacterium]